MTNRLERLAPGSVLTTTPPGATTDRQLEVLASRPHQGRFLVTFAGVDDREAAEALRGSVLHAAPLEAGPEDWFVHELIGSDVVDTTGRALGRVTSIEANPASDLLVLDRRHLVPLRFVVERTPGRLVVDPPDGLIE